MPAPLGALAARLRAGNLGYQGSGRIPLPAADSLAKGGRGVGQRGQLQKPDTGGGGLFDQFTDIIKSVPSGIAGLGADLGKELIAGTGIPGALAHWTDPPPKGRLETLPQIGGAPGMNPASAPGALGAVAGAARSFGVDTSKVPILENANPAATPFSTGIGESFGRTGYRISHPGEYAKEYRQGHILGAGLEDLANLSIVGEVGSRAINAATHGAVGNALAAGETAARAGEAADAADKAVSEAAVRNAGNTHPGIAGEFENLKGYAKSARQEADRLGEEAQAAKEAAGPALHVYRAARGVATLTGQGASIPFKPYELGVKLIKPVYQKFLADTAVGKALSEKINNASDRIGMAEVKNQADVHRAAIDQEQTHALNVMEHQLGGDPVAFQAAILDYEKVPHALEAARKQVEHTGGPELGQEFYKAVAENPGVAREPAAFELAHQLASGELERTNPELHARIRGAQAAYESLLEGPMQERYLGEREATGPTTPFGVKEQLTPAGMEGRRWNVEGETPEPYKREELQRHQEQERQTLLGQREELAGKAERAGGRRLLTDEQLKQPEATVRAQVEEAQRVARESLANPAERADAVRYARAGRNATDEQIVSRLASRILTSADRPRILAREPYLNELASRGRFEGATSAARPAGLQPAEKAAGKEAVFGERMQKAARYENDAQRVSARAAEERARLGNREAPEPTAVGKVVDAVHRYRDAVDKVRQLDDQTRFPRRHLTDEPWAKGPSEIAGGDLRDLPHAREVLDAINRGEAVPPWVIDEYQQIARADRADRSAAVDPEVDAISRAGAKARRVWNNTPEGQAYRDALERAKELREAAAQAVEETHGVNFGHMENLGTPLWQGWGKDDAMDRLADELGHGPRRRGPDVGGQARGLEDRVADLNRAHAGGALERKFGNMWGKLSPFEKRLYVMWEQGIPEGFGIPRLAEGKTALPPVVAREFRTGLAGEGVPSDRIAENLQHGGYGEVSEDQWVDAFRARAESEQTAAALRKGEALGPDESRNLETAMEAVTGEPLSHAERQVLEAGTPEEAARAALEGQEPISAAPTGQAEAQRAVAAEERLQGAAEKVPEAQAGVLGRLARQERAGAERVAPEEGEQLGAQAEAAGRTAGPALRQGVKAGQVEERARQAARRLGIKDRQIANLDERHLRQLERYDAQIEHAPARFRPYLHVARAGGAELDRMAAAADELYAGGGDAFRRANVEVAQTLAEVVNPAGHVAGVGAETTALPSRLEEMGRPGYVPGGRVEEGELTPPAGLGQNAVQPRAMTPADQRLRRTAIGPNSIEEMRSLLRQRTKAHIQNEVSRQIEAQFSRQAAAVLGVRREELPPEARNIEDEQALAEAGWVRRGADENARYLPAEYFQSPKALKDAMAEHGFVEWDRNQIFGKSPSGKGPTPDSLFLPEHINTSLAKHFEKAGRYEKLMRKYWDTPIRVWKASVLPLSPRWHVNNLTGNSIMATFTTPNWWTHLIDAYKAVKQGRIPGDIAEMDPRLAQRGAGAALLDPYRRSPENVLFEGEKPGRFSRLKDAVRHPISASYAFNGFADDVARTAVMMARKESLTNAELYHFAAQHPDLAANLGREGIRQELSVRLALRSQGNFLRMTNFERQVVRRVFPFYAWIRHITQYVVRMPVYNPLRTTWMLHLADMYGEPPEFDFLAGTIPLGGDSFLKLPRFNPFEDVSIDPAHQGSNLSPIIKIAAAAAAGFDVSKWQQMLRAPGSGRLDDLGRPGTTPLLTRPNELATFVGNMFPQVRAGRQLLESATGGQKIRYPTGQPYHDAQGKEIPTGTSAFGAIAPLLGLPFRSTVDLAGQRQRVAQREWQNRAAQARYAGRPAPPKPAAANQGAAGLGGKPGTIPAGGLIKTGVRLSPGPGAPAPRPGEGPNAYRKPGEGVEERMRFRALARKLGKGKKARGSGHGRGRGGGSRKVKQPKLIKIAAPKKGGTPSSGSAPGIYGTAHGSL